MKDKTISELVEGIKKDEIIQNVDQLVKDLRPEDVIEGREFFQVTEWLFMKLKETDEQVFPLHGLYIWTRINNNDSALEAIVGSILKDLSKLRIKWAL